MIVAKLLAELDLSPLDKIVTAVQHQDMIVVVTERGAIYTVRFDDRG